MKIHEPWTIVRRTHPSGLVVYYFRAWDESLPGHHTIWRSTGERTPAKARNYCRRLEAEGRLLSPDCPAPKPPEALTFGEWSRGFWSWEGPYIQTRLALSDPSRPSVSQRYVAEMSRILELHVLPEWRKWPLASITPLSIEAWSVRLRDAGRSGKRVNNVVICLRTMLKEAAREGRLSFNPGEHNIIRSLGTAPKARGRLTGPEVRLLFSAEHAGKEGAWRGQSLYRLLALTAAATGCRQGELLALRDEDVHDGYLHIAHSWNARYGVGPTKTKEIRDVPLPSKVRAAMEPFLGSEGFVFSMSGGDRPCSGNRATKYLCETLERLGIPWRERAICFHSFRHWLNSTLRVEGIPDPLIRRVMGHESPAMTETYSSFVAEDFAAVAVIQEKVFA